MAVYSRARPFFGIHQVPVLCPGMVLGPPSAQSPFARRRCYRRRDGVQHRLGGRYPSFIAHTGSCARPNPSPRLQLVARPGSLCRLLPAPAGRWPFPTLSLRVFPWMLGPVPRWLVRCFRPFLPPRHRPSPRGSVGRRATNFPLQVTSCGNPLSQSSSFLTFRPPGLLATQVTPTAAGCPAGRPWRLRPSFTQFVTSPGVGYASRPNRPIDGAGTCTPQDSQPCRPLQPLQGSGCKGLPNPGLRRALRGATLGCGIGPLQGPPLPIRAEWPAPQRFL